MSHAADHTRTSPALFSEPVPADSAAVWVVVQLDLCDWNDYIMQPAYWNEAAAEKRAARLNLRETDTYTYRVKKITMHPLPKK
jgi:hypothetical protein